MSRVIHFEFQVDDVERAKKFYESALGWKISQYMKKEDQGLMDYWGIETGEGPGINGGMYERKIADEKFNLYDCTVSVENIDEAIAAVKANGGTIVKEKMEMKGLGWFARAIDTEGNKFGLMQPTGWKPK
jgi:predicted enzyme related to lactoylglutathione lyase